MCSPVETENFSENQNQNHAHEDAALVHVGSDSFVADNTYAVSGCKTRHANGDAAGKVHETAEQAVAGLGVEVLCDEDGYDEGIDSDNTGHDNGDETLRGGLLSAVRVMWIFPGPERRTVVHLLANLHDQVWPECSHARNANTRFGGTVCCSCAAEDHGCRDTTL